MAEVLRGNAVVGQSGGPTVVINQSLVGVIEEAKKFPAIKKLLGARHGVRGMKAGDFADLKKLSKPLLEKIANTPAAALGSTRDKPDAEYCKAIFEVFAKNDVRYFFYLGGNDSADTARIISEMAGQANYPLRVFHVPKTIDNDLRATDHCPGYGSAARFVACAIMGDDRDNASLPGIKIDVIMGRNAGWLTAASALARKDAGDGPHLIYVPEVPFDLDQFTEDVAAVYAKHKRCLVAVSEGIEDGPTGKPVAEVLALKLGKPVEYDEHKNMQLSGSGILGDFLVEHLKKALKPKFGKLRLRADTFGYLQRSFAGFASPVDVKEARQVGRKAVQFAKAGIANGSVAIVRKTGPAYGVTYQRVELSAVARETKDMPKDFLADNGHDVTPAFLKYALPLVGKLPDLGKIPK